MSRFRVRGFFQIFGLWSQLPDGSFEQNSEKVKLGIFISEEMCYMHTYYRKFASLVLYLALNSVAMLPVTQNCTSVNGVRYL